MTKTYMKCTFENDVVLLGSANTEGKSEVLDFIPGSNFVGLVAKMINKNVLAFGFEELLNGSIRLGEATLFDGEKMSYKIPFSYFKPKKQKDKVYNHHFITKDEHKTHQMQQIRYGYIADENSYILYPEYDYQQKSAHDKNSRRSKESQMFGYPAIIAGTEWIFTISAEDKTIYDEIVSKFDGKTFYLGKSKTAQYGKVSFEKLKSFKEDIKQKKAKTNLTLLYIKSRLALFNPETGQPTFIPTIENLGLKSGEIDWENTQIRTTTFTPYNSIQKTTTYERIVIEKGSVIALKNVEENDLDVFKNGTGAYLNEGFGEVLVNPCFLSVENPDIKEVKKDEDENNSEKYIGDCTVLEFLADKKAKKENYFSLVEKVDKFEKKHKDIFKNLNSQWGVIRSYANNPKTTDIVNSIEVFISKGKMQNRWEEKDRKANLLEAIKEIINEAERVDFVKLLAMRMQSKGGAS